MPYKNAGGAAAAPGLGAMWRLIKLLLVLVALAALALIAYAYLGPLVVPADFAPPTRQVVQPVDLGIE